MATTENTMALGHLKNALLAVAGIALLASFVACGADNLGSDSDNGASSPTTARVVAALFSNPSNASALLQAQTTHEFPDCGDTDPGCTCYEVINGLDNEHDIDMGANGESDTYGHETTITVAESDFCANTAGEENAGMGPDGRGRLATFLLRQAVTGHCVITDDNGLEEEVEVSMDAGSFGVWRNTIATETAPAYAPEIYGTFYSGDEASPCTIFLGDGDGEDIVYASCEDGSSAEAQLERVENCDFE